MGRYPYLSPLKISGTLGIQKLGGKWLIYDHFRDRQFRNMSAGVSRSKISQVVLMTNRYRSAGALYSVQSCAGTGLEERTGDTGSVIDSSSA